MDNQDITKGAAKANLGKPRLELKPPEYWISVAEYLKDKSLLSVRISLWYYYDFQLISILDENIPFDSQPSWELGADKYSDHNYLLSGGLRYGAIVGALLRHANKFDDNLGLWIPRDLNELNTEYNGKKEVLYPHGCAVQWCVEVLNQYVALNKIKCNIGIDDRPKIVVPNNFDIKYKIDKKQLTVKKTCVI